MTAHQSREKWFRVEVTDESGQIVAIESEMLAGREIGGQEEATIRKAIAHLTGFVGDANASQPADGAPDDVSAAEFLSRNMWPKMWAKIDDNAADDDWHGGTALNARKSLLLAAQELVDTILEKSQPAGGTVGEKMDLPRFDAGLLGCPVRGGDVEWWHDYIRSLLDGAYDFYQERANDLRAVGEWQPIETAPKDGTWILGWSRDNQPFRISWGRNHEAELRWCTSFASFADGYITHWQPLQEPSHD